MQAPSSTVSRAVAVISLRSSQKRCISVLYWRVRYSSNHCAATVRCVTSIAVSAVVGQTLRVSRLAYGTFTCLFSPLGRARRERPNCSDIAVIR